MESTAIGYCIRVDGFGDQHCDHHGRVNKGLIRVEDRKGMVGLFERVAACIPIWNAGGGFGADGPLRRLSTKPDQPFAWSFGNGRHALVCRFKRRGFAISRRWFRYVLLGLSSLWHVKGASQAGFAISLFSICRSITGNGIRSG